MRHLFVAASLTCALHCAVLPGIAAAGDVESLFDRPVLRQTLPAKSADGDETICSIYPDMVVEEFGTNTPNPDAARLVPFKQGEARPACNAKQPQGLPLKTAGFSLLERKGPFLLFNATDPNGAEPFMVVSVNDGRIIYTDGFADNGLKGLSANNGILHLLFRRGFNAPCSLVKDGVTCWASLAHAGKIPGVLAQTAPPNCTEPYARANAPADDLSVVIYDVDMTLDMSGKTHVNKRGAPACAPLP